jgi:hypothetical protein
MIAAAADKVFTLACEKEQLDDSPASQERCGAKGRWSKETAVMRALVARRNSHFGWHKVYSISQVNRSEEG